tara:strand:- start:1699 stop:1956 length:258 start_codon:yes stop_codon:yes gene_type:complete
MEEMAPLLAADAVQAPEGVEFYSFTFPPSNVEEIVFYAEADDADGQVNLDEFPRVVGRMAYDRHGGRMFAFGWDRSLRKAVAWIM